MSWSKVGAWFAVSGLILGCAPREERQARGDRREAEGAETARPASGAVKLQSPELKARAGETVRNQSALFVLNAGQVDSRVSYFCQTSSYGVYFTPGEVVFSISRRVGGEAPLDGGDPFGAHSLADDGPVIPKVEKGSFSIRFVNANPEALVEGLDPQVTKVNYLIGNDRSRWRTGLPTFREVVYRDLWPGIDAVFRAERGRVKYEFIVHPGARVEDVRLGYEGVEDLFIDREGSLQIKTELGMLTDEQPYTYQNTARGESPVECKYRFSGSSAKQYEIGFEVRGHDSSVKLVIDPGLVFSTYLGGSAGVPGLGGIAGELGGQIKIDAMGNLIIYGQTSSTDFPSPHPNTNHDVFLVKMDSTGSSVLLATFLGGNGSDNSTGGLNIDPVTGDIYIAGNTDSSNFPTFGLPFQAGPQGGRDGFVVKMNANFNTIYSTYLGGNSDEIPLGSVLNAAGELIVVGHTASSNYPRNVGQPNIGGGRDGFITRLNSVGSGYVFSRFLGGIDHDSLREVVLDAMDNVYVSINTSSGDFPVTNGSIYQGGGDAGWAKMDSALTILFSTFLGGIGLDTALEIATDGTDVYLVGLTRSMLFPIVNGIDGSLGGTQDGYYARFDSSGILTYSTFIGGGGVDIALAVDVTADGRLVVVSGQTFSIDFPVTSNAYDVTSNGDLDVFVVALVSDNAGSYDLCYSTYIGGSLNDQIQSIFLDAVQNVYVCGTSRSLNFPTTVGAYQETAPGDRDAFVAKLNVISPPIFSIVNPNKGSNGTSAILAGANFCSVRALAYITDLGDFILAPATSYVVASDTQMNITVPDLPPDLGAGHYFVEISNLAGSSTFNFAVVPRILGISPPNQPNGETLTITGSNLRPYNSTLRTRVNFGGTRVVATVTAEGDQLTFVRPAGNGNVDVLVEIYDPNTGTVQTAGTVQVLAGIPAANVNLESNTYVYTSPLNVLQVRGVSPPSGAPGTIVTLNVWGPPPASSPPPPANWGPEEIRIRDSIGNIVVTLSFSATCPAPAGQFCVSSDPGGNDAFYEFTLPALASGSYYVSWANTAGLGPIGESDSETFTVP